MKLNEPVELSIDYYFEKSADEVSEGEPIIIRGYANTATIDRCGDLIPRSTWEKAGALDNYRKNPIILAYHNHSEPIGKALDLVVTEMGLGIEAEISPAAGKVYKLIKDGILKTFSVGMRVFDAEYKSEVDAFVLTDVELFEVSVVSVPMNQDSTFELAKGFANDADYQEFKKSFVAKPAEDKKPVVKTENTEEDDVFTVLAKELGIL